MASTLNEHYRYLKLGNRTAAYRAALQETVRDGDIVADLGAGFGILAMLALEAGAARCHGIDSSAAIEIARETMRREGLDERFNAIRASSFDTDLSEKVDLILCDHIGFFGLDYGIIALLEDAKKRFLKPGGAIMPRTMAVQIALVESPQAHARTQRWQAEPLPQAYSWLNEHEVNTLQHHRFTAADVLSDTHIVAEIDFAAATPDRFNFKASVPAMRDGTVHGLAGSFDCALSETVRLTNDPLAEEQIGRHNAFLAAREPFTVREGEAVEVDISIRHDPRVINWAITPPGGGDKQSMSTWKAMILSAKQGG